MVTYCISVKMVTYCFSATYRHKLNQPQTEATSCEAKPTKVTESTPYATSDVSPKLDSGVDPEGIVSEVNTTGVSTADVGASELAATEAPV